jgi:antitoxin MazE
MKTEIKKWGNSLALRLPLPLAASLSIVEGATVNLSIQDDSLLVTPARKKYKLSDLLADHKKSSTDETDWGKPVGEEAW